MRIWKWYFGNFFEIYLAYLRNRWVWSSTIWTLQNNSGCYKSYSPLFRK